MNLTLFENSRDIFLDIVDAKDYIQIERVSKVYQALNDSIKKPLKMVLLYGKPGTGKSMFLSKLHETLAPIQKVYLYKSPILDENEFFNKLANDLYKTIYKSELNFTQFMKIVEDKEVSETTVPIILLDEAQLYPSTMMEKIRLLSDTRKLKFVISLHKTEQEDIIAKEHFQTRIWESIKLENASAHELKIYIQKKLMKANCLDTANLFTQKSVNFIHTLTNGNYRDTNKLIYTLFDIYIYYAHNNPNKIDKNEISKKVIEMSAIHTGLINA